MILVATSIASIDAEGSELGCLGVRLGSHFCPTQGGMGECWLGVLPENVFSELGRVLVIPLDDGEFDGALGVDPQSTTEVTSDLFG
jgi:hypothetical protein